MKITLRTSEEIPSQNKTDKEHWSVDHRRGKRFERDLLLDLLIQTRKKARDKWTSRPAFVKLKVISQRRRRITDDANLRGGAKSFIDAIKRLGLIYDDDDDHVSIEYVQKTGSPYYSEVEIEVEDE